MKVYLTPHERGLVNDALTSTYQSVASELVFNHFAVPLPESLTTGPGYLWHKYNGYDISTTEADLICFNIQDIYRNTAKDWGDILPPQISNAIDNSRYKKIIFMNGEHTTNSDDYDCNQAIQHLDELLYEYVGDTDRVEFYINTVHDDVIKKCNYKKFSPYLFNWNKKERFIPNNLIGSVDHHKNKSKLFLSYCNHTSHRQTMLTDFIDKKNLWGDVYCSHIEAGVYLDYSNEDMDNHTPWQFNLQSTHHYMDTYFSIIRETPNHSLTEKTFKPMINFHPFLFNLDEELNIKYITTLHDMGFKTFDKYFNGKTVFEKLENWLLEENKDDWFSEMKDDLVHNHNLLRNYRMGDIL